MRCVYCQNYPFSQSGAGTQVSIERLAGIMLELQESGCHNINLVTPTHVVPQVLQALEIALTKGLTLPIVYNTSGYELVETLRLLEGIIDIYLPDMRYADDAMAARYSDAPDYASRDRPAVREMHRQVGDLAMGKDGIATRGLIIRLLALPQGISGTIDSLAFIKKEASPHTSLSIMSQYHPTYKASSYTELSQGVSRREYKNIVDEAGRLGLNNGWIQEMPDDTDTRFLGTNIPPRNG